MSEIKFKKFITKYEIIQPINLAGDKLNKIKALKVGNASPIIFEGLFILAVSTFEITLNDTMSIILNSMPDKLLEKSYTISKQQILDEDPLSKAIEKYINELSYNHIKEYFKKFTKITSINEDVISKEIFNEWIEFKASRNLLIHNNLIVDDIYIRLAGDKCRSKVIGTKLNIDEHYLLSSINCISNILGGIKEQLEIKYEKLTKINSLKSLWKSLFSNSVCCDFDYEWEYDEAKDEILNFKTNSTRSASLSHSEQYIFDFWYCHYYGKGFESGKVNLISLGPTARNRLKLLIDNIDLVKCK